MLCRQATQRIVELEQQLRDKDMELKTAQMSLSSQRRHTADIRADLLVREDEIRRGTAMSNVKVARAQARVSALERKLSSNTEVAVLKDELAQAHATQQALTESVKDLEMQLARAEDAAKQRTADLERQVCSCVLSV